MVADVLISSESTINAGAGDISLALAAIVVLGVSAQAIASRLGIPSILLLLTAGVAAGPLTGIVKPDEVFGELLFPGVSLAVAILLFEGGLNLRLKDIEEGRGSTFRLVTLGVVVTWVIAGFSSAAFFSLNGQEAALLGAVLVVSGPTVVIPLLRQTRPREPTASILRWEGIFIDPVGATLAVVVLDTLIEGQSTGDAAVAIATTAGAGIGAGVLGAVLLTEILRRHLVPDHLENPVVFMIVVAAWAGADAIQSEAGLFATTVLGVILANQRRAAVSHIREFEENLGTLILAGLFVILGAQIDLGDVADHLGGSLVLLAVLVLVARPVAVYASTVGSGLPGKDRAFLMCMAPRGIVAAAVSALFALELQESGIMFEELVPVTFTVIVGTVLIYGVGANAAAIALKVGRAQPKGVALVGGQPWVLDLAEELVEAEVQVLVVTTDSDEIVAARDRGLLHFDGRVDGEDFVAALDGVGVKVGVAVSRNEDLNALAVRHLADHIGKANAYLLPLVDLDEAESKAGTGSDYMWAHPFSANATEESIATLVERGGHFEPLPPKTETTGGLPMFRVDADGVPSVVTAGDGHGVDTQWVITLMTRPEEMDHTDALHLEISQTEE